MKPFFIDIAALVVGAAIGGAVGWWAAVHYAHHPPAQIEVLRYESR
jgi:hypothetical protein